MLEEQTVQPESSEQAPLVTSTQPNDFGDLIKEFDWFIERFLPGQITNLGKNLPICDSALFLRPVVLGVGFMTQGNKPMRFHENFIAAAQVAASDTNTQLSQDVNAILARKLEIYQGSRIPDLLKIELTHYATSMASSCSRSQPVILKATSYYFSEAVRMMQFYGILNLLILSAESDHNNGSGSDHSPLGQATVYDTDADTLSSIFIWIHGMRNYAMLLMQLLYLAKDILHFSATLYWESKYSGVRLMPFQKIKALSAKIDAFREVHPASTNDNPLTVPNSAQSQKKLTCGQLMIRELAR